MSSATLAFAASTTRSDNAPACACVLAIIRHAAAMALLAKDFTNISNPYCVNSKFIKLVELRRMSSLGGKRTVARALLGFVLLIFSENFLHLLQLVLQLGDNA